MTKLTYNPSEVAKLLGVAQSTVYNLIHANKIPFIAVTPKRYVIPIKALESWMDRKEA